MARINRLTRYVLRKIKGPCWNRWWDNVGSGQGSTKYICALHEGHDGKHVWIKDESWDPFAYAPWDREMTEERSA